MSPKSYEDSCILGSQDVYSIPPQSRIALTGNFSSGIPHWPGRDFLRIALWFEVLSIQSFLLSLLSQVLDLFHSPFMPLLLFPLSFISIPSSKSLTHQISSWCSLLLQEFNWYTLPKNLASWVNLTTVYSKYKQFLGKLYRSIDDLRLEYTL